LFSSGEQEQTAEVAQLRHCQVVASYDITWKLLAQVCWCTWGGAGGGQGAAGAWGVAGAGRLALVEGSLQLPSPLDTAVLMTEVLEDLLCNRRTGGGCR